MTLECRNVITIIRRLASGSLADQNRPNLARREDRPMAAPSLVARSGNVVRLTRPKVRCADQAHAGPDSDVHRRRMKARASMSWRVIGLRKKRTSSVTNFYLFARLPPICPIKYALRHSRLTNARPERWRLCQRRPDPSTLLDTSPYAPAQCPPPNAEIRPPG